MRSPIAFGAVVGGLLFAATRRETNARSASTAVMAAKTDAAKQSGNRRPIITNRRDLFDDDEFSELDFLDDAERRGDVEEMSDVDEADEESTDSESDSESDDDDDREAKKKAQRRRR